MAIELQKSFSLTYNALRMKVGDVVGYMNRDSAEFATRGVTQTNIDDFEALGNAFEVFPSDSVYQGQIKIEVDAKDAARQSCTLQIRTISGYFQQQWGNKSGQYKMLDIKNFTNSKDDGFITKARNVAATATTYLADLTGIGLTQGQIDALTAEAQTMEDKYHAIRSKIALRDIKTRERIEKGNELYAELVKYCEIGKLIWENTNEAKYNDYVIYETVHHGLSKPQDVTINFTGGTPNEIILDWSLVVDATEYEVYTSQVALGAPAEEFSLNQSVPINPFLEIIAPGFRYYYKVRAKSVDNQSAFSDEVWIEEAS